MNTIFRLFLLFVQLYGISDPATGSSSYTTAGMGRAEVPEPEWSYSNLAAWPPLCHTGMHQSPISFKNLTPSELRCTKPPQPLEFSEGCTFKAESTSLKIDNGVNTIRVTFLPLGKTAGDRTNVCTLRDPSGATGAQKYQLTAMHFHAPPEHLFPHAAPDAELHIVFKAEDEHSVEPAVVVAVQLAASDAANTSATRALNHIMIDGPLPPRQASTTCTLERNLTVAEMLPQRQSYVTYSGSLTTPPCTEGVRFVIMTTPQLISKAAFNKLSQVLRQTWPENRLGNRRPTQPLNGREVCRYVDGRHPKTSNGQGVWGDYLDTIPATGDSVSEGGNPSGSEEGVKGNLSGADVGANQTEEEKDGKQLWPYVLKPHEAILFTAAAVILVVAALILYWWSNNANEKVDANEAEWLGTAAEVYGTSSL
ncbi:carbonic anhydrase-like protein [Trypanosoma equiperdum]|uniref:carbonic anhydrase n=2 Tax=Trypanozoon TaxID=39700 RepID=Q384J3_TRYB2|nr:carbonic anhydrase-like protein [Trypanosoma brucei brucei TREU927]EAN79788.1 carbonic anhydrase-like protein [Trypanosoma brucei brucei TREU927]SCU71173.1 carbonic anhydrase-like protein [Trypanosoma equiperdum]